MAVRKHSRQRDSIREFLMTRTDHPTADTIYENLRRIYPNISLGTVYRNLSVLSETGEIRKLSGLDHSDRFDGRTDPHCHFFCGCCGKVMDLDSISLSSFAEEAARGFSGKILSCFANFYGTCEECSFQEE